MNEGRRRAAATWHKQNDMGEYEKKKLQYVTWKLLKITENYWKLLGE